MDVILSKASLAAVAATVVVVVVVVMVVERMETDCTAAFVDAENIRLKRDVHKVWRTPVFEREQTNNDD
jgi:hypothetical protein